MNPPKLVRDHISSDLVEATAKIAQLAQEGHITGLVFGILLRGRRYHVDVAGSLIRDPTFARGIVAALDDELQARVQGVADSSTTM